MPSMFRNTYNWKRFWCPREGRLDLSDGGYLADPRSEERKLFESDLVLFEDIEDVPCLALLGEPGIGKSTWFKLTKDSATERTRARGQGALWVDLSIYDHLDHLLREVFQSQVFVRWREGNDKLHVFLNGLHEFHVSAPKAFQLLAHELGKSPVERLSIRLLCATASWPHWFEQRLEELWGRQSVRILELGPLRRCDVTEVARMEVQDPEFFLKEVESRGLVPFANRPLTLALLIKTFNKSSGFPGSQIELYARGCRALCQDTTGTFDPEELLMVASRMAALTVFGDWRGIEISGHNPADDSELWLSLDEVCVGSELVGERELPIRRNLVRETIETALFTGRWLNSMGWAHQAYAEFLAAYYLSNHNLPLPQVLNLIVHPRSHHGKIRPKLREVAGWLAALTPVVFDYIISNDPEILVDCTAEIRDQEARERLVTHLLLQCEEEKSGSQRFLSGRGYRKLCHAALADQLLPLINNRAKRPRARIRAIAMAHHCRLSDVLDALVDLVLDSSEELGVRDCAVAVVASSDDTAAKARLKDFALGTAEEDPLDELKGGALTAVWPDHITAQELFAALTVPKRKNLVGQYSGFRYSHLMTHLRLGDLPVALAWVRDQHRGNLMPSSFRELSDKIMALAWEHLDLPTVLENYARAAAARLNMKTEERYVDPETAFKVFFSSDADKRRLVTEVVLSLATQPDSDMDLITARLRDTLLREDFSWLIELLKNIEQEDIQRVLAKLVMRIFNWQDGEQESVLESVARVCQPLRDELDRRRQKFFDQRLEHGQEIKRVLEQEAAISGNAAEMSHLILLNQVEALLLECEAGNYGKFFDLVQLLIRSATNAVGPDLTRCRFWQLAEPEFRDRILTAAKYFVLREDPADHEASDGRTADPHTSFVCYRILRLLFHLDRDLVTGGLPIGVWEKWATTTVTFPSSPIDHEFSIQTLLVEFASYFAPGTLIEHVIRVIDLENEELDDAPVLAKFGQRGTPFTQDRLLDKLKDPQLKSKSFERLLHFLLSQHNQQAIEFAQSLLQSESFRNPEFTDKCLSAAKLLLGFNAEQSWPAVLQAMTGNSDFGREVILQAFPLYYIQYEVFLQGLSPSQLADLFVWLHKECPPLEAQPVDHEPDEENLTTLDRITSYILTDLRDRCAVDALGRISSVLPSETWIKEALFEAEDRSIDMDWEPIQPGQLLTIVNHSRKRMVQSEAQLLNVVQESLEEFQKELKGNLPSIRDLWDQDPNNKHLFRPLDELDFSNRVARHLQNDLVSRGVVVNREVAIRRRQYTDLHVDAVPMGSREEDKNRITVIIEVKGCWNQHLFTDMRDQLVDSYLKDNQCQHGLYLVGWFYCKKWDLADYRSTEHAKDRREMAVVKAQEWFEGQAAGLSTGATTVKAFVLDASLP